MQGKGEKKINNHHASASKRQQRPRQARSSVILISNELISLSLSLSLVVQACNPSSWVE